MTTATPNSITPPAPAPIRRFFVNAHGNEDLQARLDVAAPALEALFFRGGEPATSTEPPPVSAVALGEMSNEDLVSIQRFGETRSVRYAATLVLIGRASYDPTATGS